MDYSSLTNGIIVLCVLSSLLIATLIVILIIKRQQTSRTSVAKKKQHAKITSPGVADSVNYQVENTPRTKFASLPIYLLLSSKKKMVPTSATSARPADVQLPLSMTPPLPSSFPPTPPRPSLSLTDSEWKNDQHIEKRSPIAFEEGYDPKALRLPYYSSSQHQAHRPQNKPTHECTRPLPCNMTNSPCYIDDFCLLESLDREKRINDIYYRTTLVTTSTTALHRHHGSTSSWGSSTIIPSPYSHDIYSSDSSSNNNNNSCLLSLSMAEKLQQDAELQRLSVSSYHVW